MDDMDELDDLDKEKWLLMPLRRYNPYKHWRKRENDAATLPLRRR